MTLTAKLAEIKSRLEKASITWCQLMPENFATKETGPKLCKCGAVGFPYEHRPWIDPDRARLVKALELMEDQFAAMEHYLMRAKNESQDAGLVESCVDICFQSMQITRAELVIILEGK